MRALLDGELGQAAKPSCAFSISSWAQGGSCCPASVAGGGGTPAVAWRERAASMCAAADGGWWSVRLHVSNTGSNSSIASAGVAHQQQGNATAMPRIAHSNRACSTCTAMQRAETAKGQHRTLRLLWGGSRLVLRPQRSRRVCVFSAEWQQTSLRPQRSQQFGSMLYPQSSYLGCSVISTP
jgi:hypothetical protein